MTPACIGQQDRLAIGGQHRDGDAGTVGDDAISLALADAGQRIARADHRDFSGMGLMDGQQRLGRDPHRLGHAGAVDGDDIALIA